VDDDELASLAAAREMEAVVFKSHVTITADRAWLARTHVSEVKIFGGVTLNRAVGGLDPQAVEWMWRMQGGYGRVVWFPTFDADNHVRHAGTAPSGIEVVDERGTVLPWCGTFSGSAQSSSWSCTPATPRPSRPSPASW